MARAGIITVVSSSEIFSTLWVVPFDFHVRVAKVYLDYVSLLVLHINREFFGAAGSSKRLV